MTSLIKLGAPYDYYYENSKNNIVWGKRKSHLLDLINLRSVNSCLDLGCGDGVNSYYLEQNEKQVVGVDISVLALKGLRNRFKFGGSLISGDYHNVDVFNFNDNKKYDLIITTGLYHCLPREGRLDLIKDTFAKHLKNDGLLAFSSLTSEIMLPEKHFTPNFDLPSKQEIDTLIIELDGHLEYSKFAYIKDDHFGLISSHLHSGYWFLIKKRTPEHFCV